MEAQIAAPGFWDDNERAQSVLKERTRLEKLVDLWDRLNRQQEDVRVLIELGEEVGDEAVLDEVRGLNDLLERDVAGAEFQRMLSGTHDKSPCYFSINAGAGGTVAQDWAASTRACKGLSPLDTGADGGSVD